MEAERFVEILENAGLEVRQNYSGRSMYGGSCVGFVIEAGLELRTVAELVGWSNDEEREELVQVFRKARTDSMGRSDIIVYFPALRLAE